MVNGGRGVDTTTKDDHRRQFRARERLDHDAVGAEASEALKSTSLLRLTMGSPHRADAANEV